MESLEMVLGEAHNNVQRYAKTVVEHVWTQALPTALHVL